MPHDFSGSAQEEFNEGVVAFMNGANTMDRELLKLVRGLIDRVKDLESQVDALQSTIDNQARRVQQLDRRTIGMQLIGPGAP
jgi:hypothetical protein